MNREGLETVLAACVDTLIVEGDSWWPGSEIAPVAYRRMRSFDRRTKSNSPTSDEHINDLRKGLQAHFEPDIPYTHASDWERLATALYQVFMEYE